MTIRCYLNPDENKFSKAGVMAFYYSRDKSFGTSEFYKNESLIKDFIDKDENSGGWFIPPRLDKITAGGTIVSPPPPFYDGYFFLPTHQWTVLELERFNELLGIGDYDEIFQFLKDHNLRVEIFSREAVFNVITEPSQALALSTYLQKLGYHEEAASGYIETIQMAKFDHFQYSHVLSQAVKGHFSVLKSLERNRR